jgi:ATP-dependent DNA helicase RecG
MNEDWDWVRLQKALAIEAERGYSDLVGKQYRFSEFLCLSLGKPPKLIPATERSRWQDLAQKFASYSNLSSSQRTHLVVSTRNFLHQQKKLVEDTANPPKPKTPHTSTVSVESTRDYYSRQDISLDQTLYKVVDIGRRSSYLERLGLYTVRDLLFYYPRDHLDYARQVQICHLEPGETVTIIGTVVSCTCFSSPKNKKLTIFQLVLRDPTGRIKLSNFFSGNRFAHRGWQESYKRKYPRDSIVAASGLVKQNKYGLTLDKPEIEVLDSAGDSIESIKVGRILPVYALSEGVPADTVRKAIITVLPATKQIKDPLPVVIREQYDLIKLRDAIANVHFPDNRDILGHAQRRLVFDEFFYLQLGFLQRRRKLQKNQVSASFASEGELIQQFQKLLPFKLTNAQQRVVNEITQDLQSSNPMNRLVQGDVGAGKTVVAVFAILAAIQSGYQAALMAPTEVLAQQHYRKLVGWFNLLHLPVELLTGSTKTAKRREIHAQLQTGELPLLVGTHALIQDPVKFHRLGLVVIDEQHRFGVQQRATLLAKGESPHVLSMTATPIPRTLALTLHGDLDVSQIDELPPGRQPIETRCKAGKDRSKVYDVIRREVAQGRQAYIIFPLVEESEKLDVKAAVEEYQRLSEAIFPEFQIGLLHGRMSSVDKDAALTAFRDNETQIIVSTTVIEVGVDVPNATVMVIENAERFGLSQLHQLRGRIGRGQHKSFCFLMSSSKSNDAKQRLGVLEQSQDGFIISEMDMRFRGPGAVLGTRQSGLPDFALANLVEDQEVLTLARDAAEKIILADPDLINLPSLRQELEIRYQKLLGGNILN